mgnify:CR=1 FL=1
MAQYALSCVDYVYASYALDVQPDFMYAEDAFNMSLVGESAVAAHLMGAIASDSVAVSYALLTDFFRTALAESGLSAADSMLAAAIFRPSATETVALTDAVTISQLVLVAEAVGLTDALSSVRALEVLESLGLSDTLIDLAKFGVTAAEAVRLVDSLVRFFSGDVVETVSLSESYARDWRGFESLSDQVGVAAAMTGSLVLRVTVDELAHLTDAQVLKAIYDAQVLENFDLAAVYASPDGDVTVWNINAVTGSVSQYDNYAFNSFAKFGQMFIGADENGLYELSGSDDDGDAVVARIRSGLAQLTASRFTMIRDAYLGMRSDGTFILRVTTGEGDVYDYRFDALDMRTTRVPLGKGMRSRYVSFELISDGSDFDLESVEFIPLSSTRRV